MIQYALFPSDKAAPSVGQRQQCYSARDAFYKCLVEHGDSEEPCTKLKEVFHSKCLPSWVSKPMVCIFQKGLIRIIFHCPGTKTLEESFGSLQMKINQLLHMLHNSRGKVIVYYSIVCM